MDKTEVMNTIGFLHLGTSAAHGKASLQVSRGTQFAYEAKQILWFQRFQAY